MKVYVSKQLLRKLNVNIYIYIENEKNFLEFCFPNQKIAYA
jgi:hypothetical protein